MSLYNERAVIVTGAASGIGRAISLYLADKGTTIGIFDWNETGAEETASAIEDNGGRATHRKSISVITLQ